MTKDKNDGYWVLFSEDFPFFPIPFDSIMSFDYQANGEVVDTPIEGGSFTSYNKTIKPLTITLETIFQGSAYWQAAILLELRVMQQTATRLVLVTPSGVYVDMALATILFKKKRAMVVNYCKLNWYLKKSWTLIPGSPFAMSFAASPQNGEKGGCRQRY